MANIDVWRFTAPEGIITASDEHGMGFGPPNSDNSNDITVL